MVAPKSRVPYLRTFSITLFPPRILTSSGTVAAILFPQNFDIFLRIWFLFPPVTTLEDVKISADDGGGGGGGI